MRPLALLVLVAGCYPPAPVYRVQRTARVPHASAPLRTGEAMTAPVELSVGATNAGDARTPTLASPDASVEVPTTQVRGELRFRLKQHGELAVFHEQAIESTLQPLDRTQAPVRDGTPWDVGLALRYAIEVEEVPGLTIGTGWELMSWSIPYVEYRTCVENCDGVPAMQVLRDRTSVGAMGFSLTPSYRSGNLAVFAGVYGRPHPTIQRKGSELYPETGTSDYDSEVVAGPFNWIVQAGVEYRLSSFSFLLEGHQDLTKDPVSYGPSLALAISARLPDSASTAPASRRYLRPTTAAP